MDGDAIFLKIKGELILLNKAPYETEDVLQRALAEHPEVLAGPTTSGGDTGKLLLIRRQPAGSTAVWTLTPCA